MLFDFKNCHTLIIIPARGGSKRVVGKNLRFLNRKPLLVNSIEQCLKIKNSKTIVSTDDKKIAEIANQNGAETPFFRPKEFSHDNSSSRSVIIHALSFYYKKYKKFPNMVALKPPTNPFIQSCSMENMIEKLVSSDSIINSCVSISESNTHPFRIVNVDSKSLIKNGVFKINNKTINDIERSQDWPKTWEGSPAFRLTKSKYFENEVKTGNLLFSGKTYDHNNSLGYKISKLEAYDIDDEFDLTIAQSIANIKKANTA